MNVTLTGRRGADGDRGTILPGDTIHSNDYGSTHRRVHGNDTLVAGHGAVDHLPTGGGGNDTRVRRACRGTPAMPSPTSRSSTSIRSTSAGLFNRSPAIPARTRSPTGYSKLLIGRRGRHCGFLVQFAAHRRPIPGRLRSRRSITSRRSEQHHGQLIGIFSTTPAFIPAACRSAPAGTGVRGGGCVTDVTR